MRRIALLAVLAALAACNPPAENAAPEPPAAPVAVATPLPTDAWIGQWPGVEGTFLKIEAGASPGTYALTQGTLDGVKTYEGAASGEVITFTRDGAAETIRAGSGADTGLKWLADKTDCLVIKSGEGYCH